MRGFIHVIEIIIVGLVALGIITQFALIPRIGTDWGKAKLQLQAQDLASSMERAGVDWFNESDIERMIFDLIGNTQYRVKLSNVIKPEIRVGCVCSDGDFRELEENLKTMNINGVNITFIAEQIDTSRTPLPFPSYYDVVVSMDHDLSGSSTSLKRFLAEDRGVVWVRDINQKSDIGELLNRTFGLEWDDNLNTASRDMEFFVTNSSEYFNMRKYFFHFPLFKNDFESGDTSEWGEEVGSWSINSGRYGGSPTLEQVIFSSLDTQAKDHVARFDMISPGNDFQCGWSLGYEGEETYNYIFLNANDNEVQAGRWDPDEMHTTYGTEHFTLNSNTAYEVIVNYNDATTELNVTVTKKDDESNKIMLNTVLESSQGGDPGFIVSNTLCYFDNFSFSFNGDHKLSDILNSNEKVTTWIIDDERGVLRRMNSGSAGAVVNNYASQGKGRTVWLSKGIYTEEFMQLVKASILWAAGDEYYVVPATLPSNVGKAGIIKILNRDMYQPVRVELSLGYVF